MSAVATGYVDGFSPSSVAVAAVNSSAFSRMGAPAAKARFTASLGQDHDVLALREFLLISQTETSTHSAACVAVTVSRRPRVSPVIPRHPPDRCIQPMSWLPSVLWLGIIRRGSRRAPFLPRRQWLVSAALAVGTGVVTLGLVDRPYPLARGVPLLGPGPRLLIAFAVC